MSGIAYYLLSGPRGAIKLIQIKNDRDRLKNEIRELEMQKSVLDSEKTRLKTDPEYIEKIAREEYNMKKKGEKVYKIVRDDEK